MERIMSRELRETDPAPPIPGRPEQPTLVERIDHPRWYTSHRSGVETVDICELLSGNLFNAVKYLWRREQKDATLEDCKKSEWYLRRELYRVGADRALRTLIKRVTSVDGGSILADVLEQIAGIEEDRLVRLRCALTLVETEIAKLEKGTETP
jgi:hypothetical protein